jgi:hypothetical protein
MMLISVWMTDTHTWPWIETEIDNFFWLNWKILYTEKLSSHTTTAMRMRKIKSCVFYFEIYSLKIIFKQFLGIFIKFSPNKTNQNRTNFFLNPKNLVILLWYGIPKFSNFRLFKQLLNKMFYLKRRFWTEIGKLEVQFFEENTTKKTVCWLDFLEIIFYFTCKTISMINHRFWIKNLGITILESTKLGKTSWSLLNPLRKRLNRSANDLQFWN